MKTATEEAQAGPEIITAGEIVGYDIKRRIRIEDACKIVRGRLGGNLTLNHLRRYIDAGYRANADTVIVLRTVKISNVLWTMPEWCEEFERLRAEYAMRPTHAERLAREMTTPHQASKETKACHGRVSKLLAG